MKKFVVSYSTGKDSTLALFRMINKGYIPCGLIVTVDEKENESWFHGINRDLLLKVSKSLDIKLIEIKCSGNEYEKSFEDTLIKCSREGIEICVFGDIDIESHRRWGEERCKKANMEAMFPLWNEEREKLVNEFIDAGFKAVIKKVENKSLDKKFLGKILTKEIVEKIKKAGADPCGENGEYHTFVFGGPIFNNKIDIICGDIYVGERASSISIRSEK